MTLPLIAALPRMGDSARRAVSRLLQTPEPSDAQIAEVIMAVSRVGGLDYARDRALRLAQLAEGELDLLQPSPLAMHCGPASRTSSIAGADAKRPTPSPVLPREC